MNTDLTPQVSEVPDYNADTFRSYAAIMRETFAVLDGHEDDSPIEIPSKTVDDLQWNDLRAAMARHCLSKEARTAAERLPALRHRESIERRLCEVEEATRLAILAIAPPFQGLESISRHLDHALKGGMLDGENLLKVARVTRVMGACKTYFSSRQHLAPLLCQVGEDLQSAPELVQALEHAFDAAGRLADHASPDLGALRRRVQNYHGRLKGRIESYLKNTDFQHFLQDNYFTLRNERYVLPIRSGEKGNVPGIVHGTSGSGQTLFIEPTELVELNNDLQIAQMEVAEEERRILSRLSDLVAREARKLAGNSGLMAYLDLTFAMSRLGIELFAHRPVLSRRGGLKLIQARHPMLILKARTSEKPFEVIPNDISLGLPAVEDGEEVGLPQKALIISGPNTGGKTVTLKTIGISCLMARCGLHVPALPGSEVPLMGSIFTDIGDEQSIERDLSTFSGHVANINSFIERVEADSLVLLDELFAGTDPEQGVALATALLEHIVDQGAIMAVTTHLESLKTLALRKDHFANASVGFDINTLAPTYRLSLGLPGSSYAIRIARRLGMPASIIDRAREVSEKTGAADVEKVIRELEAQKSKLDAETDKVRELRVEVQRKRQSYDAKLEHIRKREMGLIHKETRKLMKEVEQARALISEHSKRLMEAGETSPLTQKELEEMRSKIKEKADKIAQKQQARETKNILEERKRAPREKIVPGETVWVKAFKRTGEVLEVDASRKRASVRVGGIKATVTLDEIFAARPEERPAKPDTGRGGRHQQNDDVVDDGSDQRVEVIPPQGENNTVDLRGMRVDEALERMEIFLDASYRSREPGIYIIHGHGTGALRSAVRAALPSSRYIRSYRPGRHGEGGDGVTVAFFG